jgi:NAD(P)-dependent dehydrogenase (short-subunit alcohol dehydrogenase family)
MELKNKVALITGATAFPLGPAFSVSVETFDAALATNILSPRPTRTDTLVTVMGDEAAEQVGKTTLLRRLASPREIAEVILFPSPAAPAISAAPPSP